MVEKGTQQILSPKGNNKVMYHKLSQDCGYLSKV